MKFVVYQGMIVVNFILALVIGYQYIADKLHAWALFVILGFLVHLAVIVGLLLVMYWPALTNTLVQWLFKPIQRFKPDKATAWRETVGFVAGHRGDVLPNDGLLSNSVLHTARVGCVTC